MESLSQRVARRYTASKARFLAEEIDFCQESLREGQKIHRQYGKVLEVARPIIECLQSRALARFYTGLQGFDEVLVKHLGIIEGVTHKLIDLDQRIQNGADVDQAVAEYKHIWMEADNISGHLDRLWENLNLPYPEDLFGADLKSPPVSKLIRTWENASSPSDVDLGTSEWVTERDFKDYILEHRGE
jgi:hypothetical protein